jgi:DNA repair exonuclease SbcCD ATPase subunit
VAKKTEDPIRIVGVDVENFHRIRAAHIELDPAAGLVRVTGKNRAGKTSLLRSIAAALGGQGEILPAAVHTDAEDGTGRVTLRLENGYSVERRFTAASPKGYLTVVGPDGGRHQQTKLGEWLGERSFHPLALFQLRPAQLREVFLSLGTDPELGAKLDAVRAEAAKVEEERRPWNSAKQRAERTQRPAGARPEPVDVAGEMARLRDLRAVEMERRGASDHLRHTGQRAQACGRRMDEIVAEIAMLQEEEARVAAERASLRDSAAEAEAKLATTPDPSAEIAAVEARIGQAEAVTRSLEPWREYERAQAEAAEAAEEARALTRQLEKLRAQEASMLAGAGIPVEGLTFGDDGAPLLNGLPLEVASGAERVELAVAVAIADDPALRVCLVDEANDMDLEMLAALEAKAREHGFQVWVCRIGLEGAGEIVVEDGEARAANQKEA